MCIRDRAYAEENNIKIIGDLPIYVSYDSADVWAHPEEFQLDENLCPIEVAGCPPDGFSAVGQLWGNPLFNWDYMKETEYQWWVNRIAYQSKIYDVIRIDHFRGFDEYYAIPYGDSTAKNGYWKPGPGMDLFTTIENKLGKLPIIAEDLGFLTDSVKQLLASTGLDVYKRQVYYLNFKPEADEQWQELAKEYTDETGVPVTVVTAAANQYETTLKSEMGKSEAPTLFQEMCIRDSCYTYVLCHFC